MNIGIMASANFTIPYRRVNKHLMEACFPSAAPNRPVLSLIEIYRFNSKMRNHSSTVGKLNEAAERDHDNTSNQGQ
jgi:hypothetical protein